jgi:hypothetical protein
MSAYPIQRMIIERNAGMHGNGTKSTNGIGAFVNVTVQPDKSIFPDFFCTYVTARLYSNMIFKMNILCKNLSIDLATRIFQSHILPP